ncbi:hypothetical protein PoB_003770900 [Plakobranchus ocellatus]|uniref:C2H2-type domain-containing protein n=1 Tax=Plakobranchus ocellatus TaxID=259542 RepID=A0AAV4AYJ7_9GAST|nr:hypothetical protein PoB_003770900 [Plakobranchus ocellatus]
MYSCPYQDDLRFADPHQARAKVLELEPMTEDSLFTVPPTVGTIVRLAFCYWRREKRQSTSAEGPVAGLELATQKFPQISGRFAIVSAVGSIAKSNVFALMHTALPSRIPATPDIATTITITTTIATTIATTITTTITTTIPTISANTNTITTITPTTTPTTISLSQQKSISSRTHRLPHSSATRNIAQNFSHVPGLPLRYISSKPRRIGLSSFLRKNAQPIGQRKPTLSPRLGRKELPEKCTVCHRVITSTSRIHLTYHMGRTLQQTKAPNL